MTLEDFRLWAPTLMSALAVIVTIWIFRISSRRADVKAQQTRLDQIEKDVSKVDHRVATLEPDVTTQQAKLDQIEKDVSKVDHRVAKLEHDFQHLPTKEQVHKLDLAVSDMKGDVKAMNETMKAVDKTTGRLENYLLSAERARSSAA
ncbi:DUF2730 family protein [Xanthobacter sp. DSM 24535]|uniref:DUF2730 family protein n=1 Tax=Roseixanthobacter psychrophilus TaxID=3119917 RepID=UPI00372952C4